MPQKSPVGELGLTDLNSSLRRGLINASTKMLDTCACIEPSVSIYLEIVYLLKDLFMTGNTGLEVVILAFQLVLEGTQLSFKLLITLLGEAWSNKIGLELLECSTKIAGLAKRVNVCLG